MDDKYKQSIKATINGFEQSFKEKNLYDIQTKSEDHINKILETLTIKGNDTILDLGTGSGYLAFAIAKKYTDAKVIGLDILEKTLEDNMRKAIKENINNILFKTYDGIIFPFKDNTFDFVTTRYALHHFPMIQNSFNEISRVLKKDGYFFLSDPTPNNNDTKRFVDDYMKMKKDGHIKYYTKDEFEYIAAKSDLKLINEFKSKIRFPRLKETAYNFNQIIKNHDNKIIDEYEVTITNDNKYIYITQNVLNLTFQKI